MSDISKPRQKRSKRAPVAPGSFAERLTLTMTRLSMSDVALSDYLGCPVPTVRKWLYGERQPSAAVVRLLDVLGTIEALAPDLHASLVPTRGIK